MHPDIKNLKGYEQYFDANSRGRGSLAEVFINKEKGLVRKYYRVNGTTITHKIPKYNTVEQQEELFNREIKWSKALEGDNVIKLYDHGRIGKDFYLVQEYCGPIILRLYEKNILLKVIPTLKEQIIKLYEKFKEHNIYKGNNSMLNFVYDPKGKIKALDFKYTRLRTDKEKKDEIECVSKPAPGKYRGDNPFALWKIDLYDTSFRDKLIKLL